MKKWGLLVSTYYAITVIALFWPLFWMFFTSDYSPSNITWSKYLTSIRGTFSELWFSVPVSAVFLAQFLFLFVSVDPSGRRLKPRARLLIPAILTGLFTAVLGFGMLTSIIVAFTRDKLFDYFDAHHSIRNLYMGIWPFLWIVWAIVFYVYAHRDENPVGRATAWLLKGSILEFLVAVPCHVIVRRRDDCCAPFPTSLGLCTGLALMLIAFGPSVLLLYKKRLDSYSSRAPQHP